MSQYAQHRFQQFARDVRGDFAEREMRRRQRHPHAAADQHHHHLRCRGALGDEFGVAGKRNTGIIDHALVHRRRHHRPKLSVAAAVDRQRQRAQHVAAVVRIELPCSHRRRERCVQHAQRARIPQRRRLRIELDDRQRQTEQARTRGEQPAVGNGDQRPGARPLSEDHTQVGTDAGGLAGGNGDRRISLLHVGNPSSPAHHF
jgi:hypothetical protein